MIAFGSSITKPDVYRRCAEPGIALVAEPDSEVYAQPSVGSIARTYNHLCEKAAARPDLEALVLVHQDAEIASPDFCQTVRSALSDPDVAVVGCVGAVGVRSIAWWEASVTLASFDNRYEEHGGGPLPAFSWTWDDAPPYAQIGEVESIDGFVLVLSPWAVRDVRFDEELSRFHGYDLDFCLQVREAGRKVVTADFRAVHHRSLDMLSDLDSWIEAHINVAEKWHGRMPGIGTGAGTWKERALRAEAECELAQAMAVSTRLERDARLRELERDLAATTESTSWRITAPLRWLKRLRPSFGR